MFPDFCFFYDTLLIAPYLAEKPIKFFNDRTIVG